MFAQDLKVISLTPKNIASCKGDNSSPLNRYQKSHHNNNISQKIQNNSTHHNNNRKKMQKGTTNTTNIHNKNQHNHTQSFGANSRKRANNNSNNNSTPKNPNLYHISNNIVVKNNKTRCNDIAPASASTLNNCDKFVNKPIISDQNETCSFQKNQSVNNSLVSLSSLSSSTSTSTSSSASISSSGSAANDSFTNKNKSSIRFDSASSHRKKSQQIEENSNTNNSYKGKAKTLSPSVPPPMVINTNGAQSLHNKQMSAAITSSGVTNVNVVSTTVSIASTSAPASQNSYSLDFLHSVGVQMAGGTDTGSPGSNHAYSTSVATVSPTQTSMPGQRIIYQDIPPPEKRVALLDHSQNKYSPANKMPSPSYNEYSSYDIPILINSQHHVAASSINTHMQPDNFSSPYNYPPLSSYKRNSYIPISYPYQKCQNEGKPSNQLDNVMSNGTVMNGTNMNSYNRNRNQIKVWNTGNVNVHINKNGSNPMLKHLTNTNQDMSNAQGIPRIKNHQNIHNLTYVTTDPNNNRYMEGNRSQSSSPKSEAQIHNKLTGCECGVSYNSAAYVPRQQTSLQKIESSSSPGRENTQIRVASEGYESDSSNSSCGKKVDVENNNRLSSSSSSISSTDISYVQSSNLTPRLSYPPNFPEDDVSLQHFYGSDQNLSHWIPGLHTQFLYSAHSGYTINENTSELQQQQISNIKKSQMHRNSFRGTRGRNFINNNVRSFHFANDFVFTPPDRFLARSHLVEVKETPRTLLTCSKWDNLSQGIWNKFINAQQTEDTFKRKMRLWRYLYIIIKNAYPRYGLYLVGSTISGFGADTSDIDMCLVSRAISTIDPRMEALFNLTLLRDCLSKTGEFENFHLIEAKVPILRFKDRVHNLEVDLNFNNCVGIKNTHLLYCYSQLDWRLRPLVLITKLWAQYHNINNAKNMTISSYSLVLMVIHFLQCAVSPPVLPCLHELYPEKFQFILRSNDFGYVDMNETMGPYETQNTQPIGQLFLQFLQYYSTFNYSQYAISIRTGSLIPIEYCRQAKSLKNDIHQWKELCIEEPFDLTNTARSVYDFETFERVKLVFMSSCRILQETLDINSIFSPIVPSTVKEN